MALTSNNQPTVSLVIRVSPDIKEHIRHNAKAAGQTMSAYVINKCLGNDYGINTIVYRTELFNQLNLLKEIHSADEESVEILDNIASMIGGFGYADRKGM